MTVTASPTLSQDLAASRPSLDRYVLDIDPAAEAARAEAFLRQSLPQLNKRGYVLGVSGGIDSSLCVALAARACGPDRVLALLMPERDSSEDSTVRARALCEVLGVRHILEPISDALEGVGCYRRRDDAIRRVLPEYRADWRHKIVVSAADEAVLPHFKLIAESPEGERRSVRLPVDVYLEVVAATNFKQRLRKTMEYFHADRLNYAVLGTPNKLEYDLGFFVRGGDGLADVKPIAQLYKTQVYALAAHVGVPGNILRQPPSTDTYSLPQTQEEFYFALPYDKADIVLYALDNAIPAAELAPELLMPVELAEKILNDFRRKQLIRRRLLSHSLTVEMAEGVS
jgi:NAD+ synthase